MAERLPEADQQQTNADNLPFPFGETPADSLFQGNQDFSLNPSMNKDSMMENMGYDGQDQEIIPNQVSQFFFF